jgi:hypothetical protein
LVSAAPTLHWLSVNASRLACWPPIKLAGLLRWDRSPVGLNDARQGKTGRMMLPRWDPSGSR